MKRLYLTIVMAIASLSAIAQDTNATPEKTFWDDPIQHPMTPLYLVVGFVFIVLLLVAFVAVYMIRVLNALTEEALKDRAAKAGIQYVARPSWWARFSQTVNASVPLAQEKTIELDHNYDGIRELDNHLPPWWKWLFYGTIGWSVVYLIVFHVSSSLPLSLDEYNQEVAQAEEQSLRLKAKMPAEVIDETKLTFSPDSVRLIEKGKAVFTDNSCGSCHRNDGGGNTIGPNLTDTYWIHGGHITNVFATIKNGAVDKGMPAWGKALSPQQVRDVTFYILSLQGTNPADAKAPQGEMYNESAIKADSTRTQASL